MKAHPESLSHSERELWDTVSASEASVEKTRVAKLFGYPGFWFVDMFDWVLVGLAALDQHDEGYYYERYTRRRCGGDHGECLVAGVCEVLG